MYIFYLILGIVSLYFGANYLVKGSSAIALKFGVQKIIVGMTVVALGTSMPEFVVSLFGKIQQVDSVSVGNIVGSNIANLLLVLGIASLFQPLKANERSIKIDMPFLLSIVGLFIIFCYNQVLTGYESSVLLLIFVIYMGYLAKNRKIEEPEEVDLDKREKDSSHLIKNIFMTIIGIVGLVLGGNFTIKGGVQLAKVLGISELTIGLTVVALGTSLPEVFTSVVAAAKKEADISVGNVIGSNLFNTAFVLGIIPIISDLRIEQRVINFENWFMAGAHILLLLIILIRRKISRFSGILFLLLYVLFILNLRYKVI